MPAEAEPPSYGRLEYPVGSNAGSLAGSPAYASGGADDGRAEAHQYVMGVLAAADDGVDDEEEEEEGGGKGSSGEPSSGQPTEALLHRIFTIAVAGTGVRACVGRGFKARAALVVSCVPVEVRDRF